MSQMCVCVCVWPFVQDDGFYTASTWDSDGLHNPQGQRSASLRTVHIVRLQKQRTCCYELSLMDIVTKVKRKDLYLQVKTALLL